MSQFSYVNDLKSAVRMDEPITSGPAPRWMKKSVESTSSSANTSRKTNELLPIKKTPSKTPNKSKSPASRSASNTPAKPKTPGGDRFIPSRMSTNFDISHFKMNQENENLDLSPTQSDYRKAMSENLHGCDINNVRVLSYQNKAPAPPDGYQNALKVVYSQSKTPMNVRGATRYIPHAPDRILDAPEIVDDYYLNLIDWSFSNILAVALGTSVYLWNADTGAIDQLLDLEGADYVTSLSWVPNGNLLGVGTALGPVQLWDASQTKRLRVMNSHSSRVGAMSWNSHILTTGCRNGQLVHNDVRQREHIVGTIQSHTQEVCGLKWSTDGRYLASGGNDNLLNVYSGLPGQATYQSEPIYSFSQHQAAVKALDWCPWQTNVLASGGGTADRTIRFWNCNNGQCINSVNANSQVCAILWSKTYRELVSAHGFANNQLTIWKYPSLTKVAELTGHTNRILNLAMSPDGSTVLSAGADETLRMWKCFLPDPNKKKEHEKRSSRPTMLGPGLR